MEQFLQNRPGIQNQAENTQKRKRSYHRVTIEEIQNLVREVFEGNLSINKSADKLGLKRSTAKQIIAKYKQQKKREEKARKRRQKRKKMAEVPDNGAEEQIHDQVREEVPQYYRIWEYRTDIIWLPTYFVFH